MKFLRRFFSRLSNFVTSRPARRAMRVDPLTALHYE